MWWRFLHIVILTAASFAASEAIAKKIVFVVGVSTYDHFSRDLQIQKSIDDAQAVAAAFASIGFEVVRTGQNPGRAEFSRGWQVFAQKIGQGDLAALYFSGHGLTLNGTSYLLLRDTPEIASQKFLVREAPSVERLLKDLKNRGAEAATAIIDTGRYNPYQPLLGGARGPISLSPPRGTFLLHSVGAGETALDRLSETDPEPTSLFARELVRLLGQRGLRLPELAETLQTSVRKLAAAIGHRQSPQFGDALTTTVCLADCTEAAREIVPVAPPAPAARFENEVLRITPQQARVVRTGEQASALSLTLRIENISSEVQGITAVPRSEAPAAYRDSQGRDCKLTDVHGLSVIRSNDDARILAFDAERVRRNILPGSHVSVIFRFACPHVQEPGESGDLRVNLFLIGDGDIRMIEAALSGIALQHSVN